MLLRENRASDSRNSGKNDPVSYCNLRRQCDPCNKFPILVRSLTYVSKAPPLRDYVVDGVTGDPEHGGERHDEADCVHVERVLDVLAVLERLPHEQVGQEDGLRRKGVEVGSITAMLRNKQLLSCFVPFFTE